MNQGNSSGIGIGCVSWDGSVHADQFWRHYSFGNVRERPFSEIWTDLSDELMAGLKNRKPLIKAHGDRCARCKWFDVCNGNFRVRAEAVYGNVWADDPACYLTKEEIGYDKPESTSGLFPLSLSFFGTFLYVSSLFYIWQLSLFWIIILQGFIILKDYYSQGSIILKDYYF